MNQQERLAAGKKASWAGIITNVLLTVIKAFVGFIAGSTAMVADSVHSGSDIISTVIVLQGIKVSHLPADDKHHYGHGKAESVVAKLIAMLLAVTALGIGWSAVKSLQNPSLEPPGTIAVWAAVLSIAVKEWMYRYTVNVGRKIESQAIIADAWHHRTDVFSSIAALIGIGGAVLGFPILDPLAGIVVSLMILKAAVSIYWDAVSDLMDTAPPKEIIEKIESITLKTQGINTVNEIKARKFGSQFYVDLKICVDKNLSVEEGHNLASQAKKSILKSMKNIKDVLIHVNPCPNSEDKN